MTETGQPTLFRSGTGRGIALAVVLMDVFVAGMSWRALEVDRRAEYDRAGQFVTNLARVLGENLEGTIGQIDLALLACADALEEGVARGVGGRRHAEAMIGKLGDRVPFLAAIRATSEEGLLVLGKGVDPAVRLSIADRDYFLAAKDDRAGRLAVSNPLISRISGQRSMAFARPYHRPDGSFAGIVYAAVPLESFTRTLSRVNVGRDGAVVLRGADNALIARYPDPGSRESLLGRRQISPQLERILASELVDATYVARSPVDGTEKLNAYRRVGSGPFFVLVASSPDEFLQGWRGEVRRAVATVALFVLLTAIAAWTLLASLRRAGEAQFRALVDGAPVAITLVRDGRVLYVNQAFASAVGLPAPQAALGRAVEQSASPEDAPRLRERFEQRLRGLPIEATCEFTFVRPDGSRFLATVTDATVELSDGRAIIGFIEDVTERRRSEEERERLIGELQRALADVKTLSGLLPICAHCKKIRDDRGYWSRIETYIRERSNAEFTHGICPECAQRFFDHDGDEGGGKTSGA